MRAPKIEAHNKTVFALPHPLALSMTCRQLRAECDTLFFQLNTITYRLVVGIQDNPRYLRHTDFTVLVNILKPRLRQVIVEVASFRYSGLTAKELESGGEWPHIATSIRSMMSADTAVRLKMKVSMGYSKIEYDVPLNGGNETLKAMDACFAKREAHLNVYLSRTYKIRATADHERLRGLVKILF